MIADCLCTKDGKVLLLSRRHGWLWSPQDRSTFQLVESVVIPEAEDDCEIEILPGLRVWASVIRTELLEL